MEKPLDVQIRHHLARYLADELSLRQFDEWFGPNTWNIHLQDNPAAEELADEIEWRFAEFSHGDWTEAELKDLLRPLLDPGWVSPYKPASPRTQAN